MSNNNQNKGLRFLYGTVPGRVVLKLLTARFVSKAAGAYLSSPLSKPLIAPFMRKNNINPAEFDCSSFNSFNSCFTRKIKPELRPIDADPNHLIAPCDGLLSAFEIKSGLVLSVKNSRYTVLDLLQNSELAGRYQNGYCLVFRLCVNHYHRYAFVESGVQTNNTFLPGVLHTVRPVATAVLPVFTKNCREYTVITTKNFGQLLQMEVGAMLVGKIKNLHGAGPVQRGQEKGMFLYGGSTVIVLVEPGKITLQPGILKNTKEGVETPVLLGQAIATASNNNI